MLYKLREIFLFFSRISRCSRRFSCRNVGRIDLYLLERTVYHTRNRIGDAFGVFMHFYPVFGGRLALCQA